MAGEQPFHPIPLTPPPRRPVLMLVRPTPKVPVAGFGLNEAPLAFNTHWITERRDVLCPGGLDCALCRAGALPRWHAVIAVAYQRSFRPVVFRISHNAAVSADPKWFATPTPSWRGLKLTISVMGTRLSSPQRLTLEEMDEVDEGLPPAPDLAEWLRRVYTV